MKGEGGGSKHKDERNNTQLKIAYIKKCILFFQSDSIRTRDILVSTHIITHFNNSNFKLSLFLYLY